MNVIYFPNVPASQFFSRCDSVGETQLVLRPVKRFLVLDRDTVVYFII